MRNQVSNGLLPDQENKAALHQNWMGYLSESIVSPQMNVAVVKQVSKLRKVMYRKIASSTVMDSIISAKLTQIS